MLLKVNDVIRFPAKIRSTGDLGLILRVTSCPTPPNYRGLIKALVLFPTGPIQYYFSSWHGWPEVVNEKLNLSLQNYWRALPLFIGSDPEVFVGKEGKVIPAWKFLPSKKEVGGVQETPYWDGWQAEFNTKPAQCCEVLTDSFRAGLLKLRQHGELILDSTIEVPSSTLSRASAEHVALGCNASMNAYGNPGIPVVNGRELQVRFAGMHMHFGFDSGANKIDFDPVKIVKALDRTLGILLTAISNGNDNPIRRMYYGMAGEYRLPDHGLEYRVPGSWVMIHPALVHLAYDFARWVIGLEQFDKLADVWDADENETQMIINLGDFRVARSVLGRKKNMEHLRLFSNHVYGRRVTSAFRPKIFSTLQNLISGATVFDLKKFDRYWKVGDSWSELCHDQNCNFSSFAYNGGPV